MAGPGTVVLVHGGFVDGSGWQEVYRLLKEDGYSVSVVQNPTLSLEGDAAATKRVVDAQDEPVVLVGHSYGGAVIPEAGNDPNVGGARLHRGLRAGQGRVGEHAACRISRGRTWAANLAARGWIPAPRPGKVPQFIRGRRGCRVGGVHGRLTGAVGRRRPRWDDQRGGVAE